MFVRLKNYLAFFTVFISTLPNWSSAWELNKPGNAMWFVSHQVEDADILAKSFSSNREDSSFISGEVKINVICSTAANDQDTMLISYSIALPKDPFILNAIQSSVGGPYAFFQDGEDENSRVFLSMNALESNTSYILEAKTLQEAAAENVVAEQILGAAAVKNVMRDADDSIRIQVTFPLEEGFGTGQLFDSNTLLFYVKAVGANPVIGELSEYCGPKVLPVSMLQ